jgi:hypothetical protein
MSLRAPFAKQSHCNKLVLRAGDCFGRDWRHFLAMTGLN